MSHQIYEKNLQQRKHKLQLKEEKKKRNLGIPKLILKETVSSPSSGTILKPLFPEH